MEQFQYWQARVQRADQDRVAIVTMQVDGDGTENFMHQRAQQFISGLVTKLRWQFASPFDLKRVEHCAPQGEEFVGDRGLKYWVGYGENDAPIGGEA